MLAPSTGETLCPSDFFPSFFYSLASWYVHVGGGQLIFSLEGTTAFSIACVFDFPKTILPPQF